ncbi:MAG: glycoside hydrolase family 3 C-terminal domain-containing protein [Lachnospiraceae bacterium]|nr:glycoside hydrolase family 3 C-terminal domain-containing protein [Lachnospiraceae bacterium]
MQYKITRRDFLRGSAAGVAGIAMGSIFGPAMAASAENVSADELTADYVYSEGYDVDVQLEAEGAVLLKNENNILPLAEGTGVTILGAMSYNYVEGGTGSAGGNDDENTVMMNDAFTEAGLDVNADAWTWLEEQCGGYRSNNDYDPAVSSDSSADDEFAEFSSSSGDWTSYTSIHEFASDVYEGGADTLTADGYTGYAIATFARSGAEGASPSMDYDGDGSTLTGKTYLELDEKEIALLEFCAANYEHTIVLINSSTPMGLGFLEDEQYNIEACLWIGHPGEAGLVGVGTILTGRTTPSGHLVDTYAYDMTTNPTYYNTDDNRYANADGQTFYQYEEGIYVGYRYYETADAVGYFDSDDFAGIAFKNGSVSGYDAVVQYPFGYGLSYTTFEKEITASDITLTEHGTNSITVTVTNTGDYAGKEVVQLYMDAPYQTDTENFGIKGVGLAKAKVVLIGFEKTDTLEAGESQDITIEFATDDLASFDNFGQGCYVLEAGDYKFNIQDNAHQWGEDGSDNAAAASVSVILESSIIYNDSDAVASVVDGAVYAGARDSDIVAAVNAMDDVTAGDGNMLAGYLSRNDIAGGMSTIMQHTSNEEANETVTDDIAAVLALSGTDSYDYTFSTYLNGELTSVTETLYAHGSNMMPYAQTTPDGLDAQALGEGIVWGQTYYVMEGETTESGLPVVVDAEPSDGSYHMLTVDDMINVPIDTEEGLEIWDMLASETSQTEAIELQGNSGWKVPAVDSVGKPETNSKDGPGEPGNGTYNGTTWFASAVVIASTWNKDLARSEGVAYGNQCKLYGVNEAYAPAMNTHRSPFGGRNFEYYSEDGFLAGEIGGNAVAGIQSTGTGVFIKHCALNDGDTNRGGNTTWANEQAIREIYMVPFEISIKKYGAGGVMGSLNRIGMTWFHYGMYVTMMRNEWGWNGNLITDGDGGDGDTYNSAQAMMCVQGSILNFSIYINAEATVAAFGDATQYAYTDYMLHNIMRSALYQYVSEQAAIAE